VSDDKRSGACFGISLGQLNLKETAHNFVSPKRIGYATNKWNCMAPGFGSIIEAVQLNLNSWNGSEVAKLERVNQDADILAALKISYLDYPVLIFLPSAKQLPALLLFG